MTMGNSTSTKPSDDGTTRDAFADVIRARHVARDITEEFNTASEGVL